MTAVQAGCLLIRPVKLFSFNRKIKQSSNGQEINATMTEASNLHSTLYKVQPSQVERQSDRRRNLLLKQRQQRDGLLDDFRGIQEFVAKLRHHKKRKKKPSYRQYRNHLQLSEWLSERPCDIENWYMVPCPKGTRCIVVAADGQTEVYSKYGVFIRKFHSALPGDQHNKQLITILDCLFTPESNEYWALDVLAYGNQEVVNCDAAFRFFWLANKIREDELSVVTAHNDFALRDIRFVDCADDAAMTECLAKYPMWTDNVPQLDGVLFYHKESSYVHGRTPLVGWLFAFMVPEVLSVRSVHPQYVAERPANYTNYEAFIGEFNAAAIAKKKAGRQRRRGVEERMDDSQIDDGVAGLLDVERALEIDGECIDDVHYDENIND